MKREIKFRIWDKQTGMFFEPTYEAWGGRLEDISITLSGRLLRRTLKFPAEDESMFPDRYELMQFTGLKDKNGVEIYEGDIIKWFVYDLIREGIVQYIDNYGGYDMKHFKDDYHVCCDWLRGDYEVIGNIYENPELIN